MRHVVGMAKSPLNLSGAKSRNLELDFLRLIYAVQRIESAGDSAKGYLVVLTNDIAQRVEVWREKYEADEAVEVVVADLSDDVRVLLEEEKKGNVAGMIAGSTGQSAGGQSDAGIGREIGEKALREHILRVESGIVEVVDRTQFPFEIQWDFYGIKR